jgi:hypothetical protein
VLHVCDYHYIMLQHIDQCFILSPLWRNQWQRQLNYDTKALLLQLAGELVHTVAAVRVGVGHNANSPRREHLLQDKRVSS